MPAAIMMNRAFSAAMPAVLLAVAALAPAPAVAASNKLIAVLPLDASHAKQKLDGDAQASLGDMPRDVATDAPPQPTTGNEPPPSVTATGPRVKKSQVTAVIGTLTVTAKPKDAVRIDLEDPDGQKTSSGSPYENRSARPGRWKITARASGY